MHVFAHFGVDLYAQSALINEISASELSQKFTKAALLVGPLTGEVLDCAPDTVQGRRSELATLHGLRRLQAMQTLQGGGGV